MKKTLIVLLISLTTQAYSYTDTVKFDTKGISINGSKPEKQICVFRFKNSPKPFAQCLINLSKKGSIECPNDFKIETIARTCLELTKTEIDDIGDIDYDIYDEKGKLLNGE